MKHWIKTGLAAVGLLASAQVANAQLQKGNLLLGSQVGAINFGEVNDMNFSMGFSPRVGYFFIDNLAVGISNPWSVAFGNGSSATSSALSFFGRYYFNDAKTIVLNKARFFVGLETGFGGNRYMQKVSGVKYISKNNYGLLDVEAGFAYFLSSNVALEAALALNNTFYKNASNTHLGIRLGFQIHLPTSRVKEAFQDVKNGN